MALQTRQNSYIDPLLRHHTDEKSGGWAAAFLGAVETNVEGKSSAAVADPETSSPAMLDSWRLAEEFTHAKWWGQRKRVLQVLELVSDSPATLQRVKDCGKFATVQRRKDTGQLRIRGSRCKHRFCPRCSKALALNVADNLATKVKAARLRCSHAVLTLKHRDASLLTMKQRLYRCFKTLRNRPDWKRHVAGGAAFFQAHVSLRDGQWHTHLHLILEHRYWDQAELSRAWHEVTKDSSNVWIERIQDVGKAVREATRYVASPIDKTTSENLAHLAEAIATLQGARLCFTFGTWRGFKLSDTPPEDPSIEWEDIALLGDVLWKAHRWDPDSRRILAELTGKNVTEIGPPTLFHNP